MILISENESIYIMLRKMKSPQWQDHNRMRKDMDNGMDRNAQMQYRNEIPREEKKSSAEQWYSEEVRLRTQQTGVNLYACSQNGMTSAAYKIDARHARDRKTVDEKTINANAAQRTQQKGGMKCERSRK